jgi:putative membrane protein
MRKTALMAGLAILTLIWGGPLLSTWRESFAAHMLAHMGVVAVAAPLVAIGIVDWLRPARGPRSLPVLASLVDLIVVWGWHAPALRALVVSSPFTTGLEQMMFLAAGLFLWLTCLSRSGAHGLGNAAGGAFGLLFTSVHMTLLGALLSLSPRPLFGEGDVTCLGLTLSADQDQALGGVVMLMVGAMVYLAGGIYLLSRLLGHDVAEASRR